jgi:large subunit ribosomal protein L22
MEQTLHKLGRLALRCQSSFCSETSRGAATSRLYHHCRILYADNTINPLQQVPATSIDQADETGQTGATAGVSTSRMGEKRAHAVLRGARIGPRKLNSFVDVIRGVHIDDALIQCKIHNKKAARLTEKLLESARANAVNNHGLDGSQLMVDQAWVGKGQYLRRVSIHGRGRSGVMHKTRSHLTVVLKEEDNVPRKVKVMPMVQERSKWKR